MTITTRLVTDKVLYPDGSPWVGGVTTYRLMQDSYVAGGTFPKGDITATADSEGYNAAELWCNTEGYNPSWYAYILPDGSSGTFELNSGTTPISLTALRLADNNIPWTEADVNDFLEAFRIEVYEAFANTENTALGDGLVGARNSGTGAIARTVHDKLGDSILLTDYDTFANVVTAADGKTLVINSSVTVAASVIVPNRVTLRFERNGLLTIASGQTLTIDGPIEAGPWQIFAGPGTVTGGVVDAVYPEWFGALAVVGTNDTTAAITAAIVFAAGREVLFTQPLYPARNLAFTTVPVIKLRALHDATIQHLYDGVLYDETLLSISNFTRIELRGLTLDCAETCARCSNIANLTPFSDPDEIRSVTVEGCRFINGKQYQAGTYPINGTDRAIGLRVQGYVTTLDVINKNEFNNFYSIDPVKPIARGILVARASDGGSVSVTRIIDNDFENIGPSDDGDAIQVISADPPANSVALVTHNRFRNCAKRSFKSQCASSVFTHNYTYRDRPFPQESDEDEGEEGPGCEVSILRGGGIVAHNRAYYESGAMPPMFVAINTMVESPTIVESNNIWCADPDDIMHRFVHLAAIVTDQNVTVQRGTIIRGNVVNVQMEYFCRIRPEAFTSNSGYNIDGLVLEDNQVQNLTLGFISLERSGPSGGTVNVRGVVRRNRHFGSLVHGCVWRYTNVTFALTGWRDNDNIAWWSSASSSATVPSLSDPLWDGLGQTITIVATGGTFTISGNGSTTAALAYNASTSTVQAAIRALDDPYDSVTVTAAGAGQYVITFPTVPIGVALLTANGGSLTGPSASANVTGYAYSGSEFETDYLPSQALYYDSILERGAAVGRLVFSGTDTASNDITNTCLVKHDGRATLFVKCAYQVQSGTIFDDRAAWVDARVSNESSQILIQYLNRKDGGAGSYSGTWSVVRVDSSTIDIRKTGGTGGSSATWWVEVTGTTRIRKG